MWLVVSCIIFGAALIAPFLGKIGNMISPSPPTKEIEIKDGRVINKYVDTLSFQLIDIDKKRGIASIEQIRQFYCFLPHG